MPKRIVLLSGRIGSGKSTLARMLRERYQAEVFRTRDEIERLTPAAGSQPDGLQRAGDALDVDTGGGWVAAGVQRRDYRDDALIVVNAVRIEPQIEAFRKAYGQDDTHIHVTAPIAT